MKVVGIKTIYLWKTEETLYSCDLDCSFAELARLERAIPRINNPLKYEQRMKGKGNRYASFLIIGIKTRFGAYLEVTASINTGGQFGSISIYASELSDHRNAISTGSEIKLLRYEI